VSQYKDGTVLHGQLEECALDLVSLDNASKIVVRACVLNSELGDFHRDATASRLVVTGSNEKPIRPSLESLRLTE
jgi:hypothetical protein